MPSSTLERQQISVSMEEDHLRYEEANNPDAWITTDTICDLEDHA